MGRINAGGNVKATAGRPGCSSLCYIVMIMSACKNKAKHVTQRLSARWSWSEQAQ